MDSNRAFEPSSSRDAVGGEDGDSGAARAHEPQPEREPEGDSTVKPDAPEDENEPRTLDELRALVERAEARLIVAQQQRILAEQQLVELKRYAIKPLHMDPAGIRAGTVRWSRNSVARLEPVPRSGDRGSP